MKTLLACLVIVGVAKALCAQSVLRTWPGAANPATSVDSLPDLDGDGFRELLLGNSYHGSLTGPGRVYCISGLTGATLYSYVPSSGMWLGSPVATLGDMTGDGYKDFGAGGFGTSWAFDGRSGAVLFQRGINASHMATVGDLNADGLDEALFGTAIATGGRCFVYLGGSFELLYTIVAPPVSSFFGAPVVGLGDVDSDKVPDFAVSAPGKFNVGYTNGKVYVYSGADGRAIYTLSSGQAIEDEFGGIAVIGDVTGDGITDLAVGCGKCNPGYFTAQGQVYFFDGRTGAPIGRIDPPPFYVNFGSRVESLGDIDGNGYGDILIGTTRFNPTPPSNFQEMWVVDGKTHETIYMLATNSGLLPVGDGIDWNDDDFPDFLLTPLKYVLWSGAPIGVRAIGQPCPWNADLSPRIGATGSAEIGEDYPIHLSRVRPNRAAFLVTGTTPVSRTVLPLVSSGASSCPLLVVPSAISSTRTREIRPGEGAATIGVPIPNDPALQGTLFYAQWLVMGEANESRVAASTRMLEIQIQ